MPDPVSADVIAFLTQRAGVTVSGSTIDGEIAKAIGVLEDVSGYRPFVAGATATNKTVLINRPLTILPNSFISPGTITGVTGVLEAGTVYDFVPYADDPKSGIRWLAVTNFPVRPVTVNARWGYAADYPSDVFHALLAYAGGSILGMISDGRAAKSGISWTDGDVSQTNGSAGKSGTNSLGAMAHMGSAMMDEAILVFKQHKRIEAFV